MEKNICGKLCSYCGEQEAIEEFSSVGQYDSPWDDEPSNNAYCSEECLQQSEDSYYSNFSYQYCDICNRSIIQRCPSNGWREYFKLVGDDLVCCKCYQEYLLEHGLSESGLLLGKLNGDFFNNDDLIENGYKEIDSVFVTVNNVKDHANRLIDLIRHGKKVLVNYEHLSMCGSEGSVSLWAK